MSISPEISVSVNFPADFSPFTLGAYSGLDISLSAGTITKATLTTSPASVTVAASLAAGMQAACLRFDAVANTYTYIDGVSYNANKTMTVDLPEAGFYAFVSASASVSVPLPTIYAEARVTSAASVKTISYSGGELTLGVQTTTDNMITCTKKSSSTTADPTHKTNIGAFFDIELETEEELRKGEIMYAYDFYAVAAVRTNLSHSTYTHAWEQTRVHSLCQYSAFTLTHARAHSLPHTHTHTSIHTCATCTVYITTVSSTQTRACGASTNTRAHLLCWVHTCIQKVVPC